MKIIQIGAYPLNENLIKGGIEASVFGLSHAQAKLGCEVTVITMPSRDIKANIVTSEETKKPKVFFLSSRYRYTILNVFYLKKILNIITKEINHDVVHIHGTSLLALLLLSVLRLKRFNVVTTIHGIVSIEHWKLLKRSFSIVNLTKFLIFSMIEILQVNISNKIIVDTEYVSDILQKITYRQILVISQGIDNSFYQISDNFIKNSIISIGVISPRKGYEYSIQALSKIKKDFPDLKYNIVGILKQDNKLYYEKLKKIIKEEGMDSQISLWTDIPFFDLQRLLGKAELFILHSAEESQGIAFCEAMAVKKPIVATKVGGVPFVVKNGENGFLSEYGDVNAFANNIRSILSDTTLREEMSNKSFELSRLYNWENISKKTIMTVYQAL